MGAYKFTSLLNEQAFVGTTENLFFATGLTGPTIYNKEKGSPEEEPTTAI